ncbi:hypothetical protein NLU13_9628 [Sarocladium strictum]|uniref:Fungal lipase-type domain-containing protein n=1 Tax=Sarocladium strictum TaxID=5046 RepID=A0AA39L4D3_SARSR|nr:hypothetical protein NLU13_9628 [Sarocladium strictum]
MKVLSVLSLASLATASPLGSVAKYASALEGRDQPAVAVTEQNLDDFRFYVQHAGAAYCNVNQSPGTRITCADSVCPDVEGDAVTVVNSFSGLVTGIAGYVATDNARREIVLSVRGSNNIRNWITDVVFTWTDCPFVSDCKVHQGFSAAWDEIAVAAQAAINTALAANPGYRVIATGHSLGGAVATLGAVYLRQNGIPIDTYSYGSPRVGNDKFANFVSNQTGGEYRVTHTDDPVPRLPPIIFGYRHVTPEYWLSTDAASNDYPLNDIRVCAGIANIGCNGGTFGLDIDSHGQYFIAVSSCAPPTIKTLAVSIQSASDDSASDDISDEELEERLNSWSQQDQDFVNNSD